ncbi:MAG: polysaccharide deacetylase family protein [Clostridia bacterium]|nr:polysaccharide deacetylase family protein [Clostridia bacterium]
MKRWATWLLAVILLLSACNDHAGEEPTRIPTGTTTSATTVTTTTTTTTTTATASTTTTTVKPTTTTTAKTLPPVTFDVTDPENTRGLSTERIDFSFGAAKGGKPHSVTVNNQQRYDTSGTNTLAWDNKSGDKVLYLTFECGYEYGNLTSVMLDTLKEKRVPGAFFCTLHYLKTAPEVVVRMINEGHIVGNHSKSHPSDCAALSRTALAEEVLGVHNHLRTKFGYDAKYWRFPAGVHSENALELVDSVGYRSVFWSIAHTDWDPKNQPGEEKSFQTVTERLHPGAVILLHTTSPDNAAILGRFIDYARAEGYTFRSLDDYEYWK